MASELACEATWTDHLGRTWKVPQIKGRLKPGKCAGHAALRDFVIHRDGGACKSCGTTHRLVADHIVSRRNGGTHHPKNLQCLCDGCNARKANLVDRKAGSR
jgi:5-methylcytosine-specific restriction endonuclease McrA